MNTKSSALRVHGLTALLAITVAGAVAPVVAQHAGHTPGTVDFPISCTAPARSEFNRAMALLHHMTYPEAKRGFARAAQLDPTCAMAHWGIAMTLFTPLWPTRPSPADLQRGWDEVMLAKRLQPDERRERMFIATAEAFFRDPGATDYWQRIGFWEQASEALHRAFPDDPDAAALYALAHLATAGASGNTLDHANRAAGILEQVHARHPGHPGAMHYMVHANDIPGRERQTPDITRTYETIAPNNPHALHMPTHIHTRLGDWDAVIRGNRKAAEAALSHTAGDKSQYVWDEFAHAIEYLVYAHLQKGEFAQAASQIKRLRGTANIEPTFKTAFHLAATEARYALERDAWREAAAIVPRQSTAVDWDKFAWPEAISRFARGLGAARLGNTAQAKIDLDRLIALEAAMTQAGEKVFATNISILGMELGAWIAQSEGRHDAALAGLLKAADLEASTPKHPVTPGPILPAAEQLGDLLMLHGNPSDASLAYQRALELAPNRRRSRLALANVTRPARASN